MIYTLPFIHALFGMLILFNGQLCAGWQSPEEKRDALERRGLHVNDAPAEHPLLPADINNLPIRYMIDSPLDEHALWQGRTRWDNGNPYILAKQSDWISEKNAHERHNGVFKQCTIGQILNTNPEYAPLPPKLPKKFFWETFAYAFGTPFIFMSGAAIFSAYHIKDVPLQKWAHITAALGGLWVAWGLFDSCFIDSDSKYHRAINAKDNALRESVEYFDPKKWLADRSRETGIIDSVKEFTGASSSSETEYYKPICESLKSNQENIQRAIQALPVTSYEPMAQQFYAEAKKQEDIAFILGGGSVAALALLLARRVSKI